MEGIGFHVTWIHHAVVPYTKRRGSIVLSIEEASGYLTNVLRHLGED